MEDYENYLWHAAAVSVIKLRPRQTFSGQRYSGYIYSHEEIPENCDNAICCELLYRKSKDTGHCCNYSKNSACLLPDCWRINKRNKE